MPAILKTNDKTNLDAPQISREHKKIIQQKQFLKKLYTEWYQVFTNRTDNLPEGVLLEIGSGGGFIKELNQEIVTSDVIALPEIDMTFSATQIPLKNNSTAGIFMLDVLHHLPDCQQFFNEAKRILKPGGQIVMIEPANTAFSRIVYRNFHHEKFDANAKQWKQKTANRLSAANQALPWIIFTRDVSTFRRLNPEFSIKKIQLHTPFRYVISGGLSYKALVPAAWFGTITSLEKLFRPLYRFLAMFQTIVIEKQEQ